MKLAGAEKDGNVYHDRRRESGVMNCGSRLFITPTEGSAGGRLQFLTADIGCGRLFGFSGLFFYILNQLCERCPGGPGGIGIHDDQLFPDL